MRQAAPQARLSDDEIRAFSEIGWVTRRRLFGADEITRMQACFDRLEASASHLSASGMRDGSYFVIGENRGRRVIERVVWAGASQRYLLAVGRDPRLTVPSAQLLNSKAMDHLLSQAHFKRPGDGVTFDWHQDIEHRDKGNGTWTDVNGCGSFVQTIIVLDPMTPENGPLKFMPGSSKWGRLARNQFHGASSPSGRALRPNLETAAVEPVTVVAEPGDTLFFGPYTVHASFENHSDRYRRVLINGYAAPGANRRVYPGTGAGRRIAAPAVP